MKYISIFHKSFLNSGSYRNFSFYNNEKFSLFKLDKIYNVKKSIIKIIILEISLGLLFIYSENWIKLLA